MIRGGEIKPQWRSRKGASKHLGESIRGRSLSFWKWMTPWRKGKRGREIFRWRCSPRITGRKQFPKEEGGISDHREGLELDRGVGGRSDGRKEGTWGERGPSWTSETTGVLKIPMTRETTINPDYRPRKKGGRTKREEKKKSGKSCRQGERMKPKKRGDQGGASQTRRVLCFYSREHLVKPEEESGQRPRSCQKKHSPRMGT